MAAYINPSTMSQADFLAAHGIASEFSGLKAFETKPSGHTLVCLLSNPDGTLLAVCPTQRHAQDFDVSIGDRRPRQWFYVLDVVIKSSLSGIPESRWADL